MGSKGSNQNFPKLETANRIVRTGYGTNNFRADNGDNITISYNRNENDYELRVMPDKSLRSEVLIAHGSIHDVDYELRRRYHIGVEQDR